MPSNTIACESNGFQSRISRLTSIEQQNIDALLKSGMDLSIPFTARQACEAIKTVPLNSGKVRTTVPNNIKFVYIMKKSRLFEMVSVDYSPNVAKKWVLFREELK